MRQTQRGRGSGAARFALAVGLAVLLLVGLGDARASSALVQRPIASPWFPGVERPMVSSTWYDARRAFDARGNVGPGGTGSEIYAVNADGSGKVNLTNDPADDFTPSWSPDGTKIAFARWDGGSGAEVYVMNADGTGQTNLTNNPADDSEPAWSPDGTKIAFTRRDETARRST